MQSDILADFVLLEISVYMGKINGDVFAKNNLLLSLQRVPKEVLHRDAISALHKMSLCANITRDFTKWLLSFFIRVHYVPNIKYSAQ